MSTTLARTPAAMPRRQWMRMLKSLLGWSLSALAFVLLAYALLDILLLVLHRGLAALNLKLFTTPTSGVAGGLLNAIEGSALLTFGALLLAVPVGVLGGVYVSEYSRDWLARMVRFVSDVLVGVPSIVFGLFGYLTLVTALGWKFSLAAGCITLAMMIAPYILRTTELALRGVAWELREASYALGAGQARTVLRVLLRECVGRVVTGILLATAISQQKSDQALAMVGLLDAMLNDGFVDRRALLGPLVELVIDLRAAARAGKDFATSDRIRDVVAACGIVFEDGPDGTTWRFATSD